jgi:uncharacterized protein YjbI with pentapeptide repeats
MKVNRYYIGPGTDLGDAKLASANLRNVERTGARLERAALKGVDPAEADLRGATLDEVKFQEAKLIMVKFVTRMKATWSASSNKNGVLPTSLVLTKLRLIARF